jgi:hypothetical protein
MEVSAAERCESGLIGRSRKPLSLHGFPGFESLPLRHLRISRTTLLPSNCESMSVVTNVVFKTSAGDKSRIATLNAAFQSLAKKFVSCDHESLTRGWYAGNKMLECVICPGAFHNLNVPDLVDAIREVDWDDPRGVQLFVQEQEDDRLREVDLGLL